MSINGMQNFNNGDLIDTLPQDDINVSIEEQKIADVLFKKQQTAFNKILNKTSDVILAGFIFVLFLLPQVDIILMKIFPSTSTSIYILGMIKTLMFMLLFFTLKNIYLVRNV